MRAGRDEDERGEHDGDEPDRPERHAQSPLLPGLPKTSGRQLLHVNVVEIGGFPALPRIAYRSALAYLSGAFPSRGKIEARQARSRRASWPQEGPVAHSDNATDSQPVVPRFDHFRGHQPPP